MYVDPRKEPNKWIACIVEDFIDQNTDGSRKAAAMIIRSLAHAVEPNAIYEIFPELIAKYVDLLDEEESNQNTDLQK